MRLLEEEVTICWILLEKMEFCRWCCPWVITAKVILLMHLLMSFRCEVIVWLSQTVTNRSIFKNIENTI